MLSFEEASKLIFNSTGRLGVVQRDIEQAVNYVLAEDIVSPIAVLPFRNSAMDGFALRSEWIENSSPDNPVSLPVMTTVYAGSLLSEAPEAYKVIKIMTGAPVPEGYDTVVKFEDTTYYENKAVFTQPSSEGAYIRPAGEDITKGQLLFSSGHRLQPLDTGVLASVGSCTVTVFRKPTVLIASTGNELVRPGEPLGTGQIYDSNGATIKSLIHPFAEEVESRLVAEDNIEALQTVLNSDHDVVITSAGVSAGERDLLMSAAEACGWATVFHRAKIKPGKPVYFARCGRQLLFGLPGNPLSAAVTCAIFAIPSLKKMIGREDFRIRRVPASLERKSIRKTERMLIWPGKIHETGERLVAEFSAKESSAALSAVLNTDGLIFQDIPDDSDSGMPQVSVARWQQMLY